MDKKSKRNVKFIALAVAAVFALGIVGIALTQTQIGYAAPRDSAIGIIDFGKALQSHPDMANAQTEMQREGESLQKDFEEKSKTMSDQDKQNYFMQLQQRMQQKEMSLIGAINEKIEEAVKKVAAAKGLSIVVFKNAVIFGGTDITDDVIKAFGK